MTDPDDPRDPGAAVVVHVRGGVVTDVHRADGHLLDFQIHDMDAGERGPWMADAEPNACRVPECIALREECARLAAQEKPTPGFILCRIVADRLQDLKDGTIDAEAVPTLVERDFQQDCPEAFAAPQLAEALAGMLNAYKSVPAPGMARAWTKAEAALKASGWEASA